MNKLEKENSGIWVAVSFIALVFIGWWWPYFTKGWLPLSEWGYGLIWGDWLSDRYWLVLHKTIPEWNPNYVLGLNYIGRDPFNNPLSLGNIFKFLFTNPKSEWIFGLFFYSAILGSGTYVFLRSQDISKKLAVLGAALIIIYPKWMDDIHHGPGKFIAAYSMVPWIMYIIFKMFQRKPRFVNYLSLGILSAIIFLGSGAWVALYVSYLLFAYFLYNFIQYLGVNRCGKIKIISANLCGIAFSMIIALGLSAYLLLPLLDNLHLSMRSLYSLPAGYGLLDAIGLFFPWVGRIYSAGVYDLPITLPKIGSIANLRFYFGILFIPILIYVLCDKQLRKKYIFFWAWPIIMFFLFSKIGNMFFPIAETFEKLFKAQTSQNFLFFCFIFCLNIIIVAGLDAILKKAKNHKQDKAINSEIPLIIKRVSDVLFVVYVLAVIGWILGWILSHAYASLLTKFFSQPFFAEGTGLNIFLGAQLVFYSYFHDYFFYLFLASFIIRAVILWWFRSESFVRKSFGLTVLGVLLVADFILIPMMVYPFTARIDTAYSPVLEQNAFINKVVNPTERIGTFLLSEKYPYKFKLFKDNVSNKYGKNIPWSPESIYNDFRRLNPDIDFFEALYDPASTYYPVTVGKATYNYHASFMPEYFYDFDKALNENNPRYSRNSWNSVWDPNSPLVNVAGISYIFWYEPLNSKNLELVMRYPVGDGFVYRNNKAVKKAYLVSKVEYFDKNEGSLKRMKEESFDPAQSVVTEDKSLANQFSYIGMKNGKTGNVSIISYGANRISLKVNATEHSVLVVTDLFFPHWTASIDGIPAKIYRVNCVFRGLAIEKGIHNVEMKYRNAPFHTGIKITLSTLAFIIFFVIVTIARKQK